MSYASKMYKTMILGLTSLNCIVCPLEAVLSWSCPVNLSTALKNASGAHVVIDADGNAAVVWSRYDGSRYIIQSATAPIGGPWTKPVNLSPAGKDALLPDIAADLTGDVLAVWSCRSKQNTVIQGADNKKKKWTASANLSKIVAKPDLSTNPRIACDPRGNAIAVWQLKEGTSTIIQSATKLAGKNWSQPLNITNPDVWGLGHIDPQLSIDSNGHAIAVWTNESTRTIQSSTKHFKDKWSMPVDLSEADAQVCHPQIIVDSQGNATAIWSRNNGLNYIIQSASKPINRAWSRPVDLSDPHEDAQSPQLTADPSGNVFAIWQKSNGSNTVIQLAVKCIGTPWSPPIELSDCAQDASEPKIKAALNGDVIAIWKISDGTNFIIQAMVKPCGNNWRPPTYLSLPGQDAVTPELAVDSKGNAVAVWKRSNGANSVIQSCFGININD